MTILKQEQYFKESRKVVQTVLETEERLLKELSAADKLKLVLEHKEKAKSEEEYEELEKEQRELEKTIRFQKFPIDAIPKEHQKIVKRNLAVEQLEVDEELNELKAELASRIEQLEEDLLPLLTSINELEQSKSITPQVNLLMNAKIGQGAPYPVGALTQLVACSSAGVSSAKAVEELRGLIGAMKGIKVPVETKGLLQFLKRGKK